MKSSEIAEVKQRFKDDLNRIMKEKGITQADVIRATGIASGTLSAWVSMGTANAGESVKKLAEYLGMDISYLRGGSNYTKDETVYPVVTYTPSDTPGKWVCSTKYRSSETTEIIDTEEKERREGKKPMLEEVNDLTMNDKGKSIWVNGIEWNEQKIKEFVVEAEDVDKALDTACEKIQTLETQLDALQERYRILDEDYRKRDKEAIKLQVEKEEAEGLVKELRDELLRQVDDKPKRNPLLDMTVEEAMQIARGAFSLFNPEVLK